MAICNDTMLFLLRFFGVFVAEVVVVAVLDVVCIVDLKDWIVGCGAKAWLVLVHDRSMHSNTSDKPTGRLLILSMTL